MAIRYKDVRETMESLPAGCYSYIEVESREDATRVARLVTQIKHRTRTLERASFSTSQGVAVLSGEPVYIIRISRDA